MLELMSKAQVHWQELAVEVEIIAKLVVLRELVTKKSVCNNIVTVD